MRENSEVKRASLMFLLNSPLQLSYMITPLVSFAVVGALAAAEAAKNQ